METNHVKTQILPILGEVIAYLHNKSYIFKKISHEKFYFSTTSSEKSAKFEDFWQNNCLFTKAIVKNYAFQKIHWEKKLCQIRCIFMQPI